MRSFRRTLEFLRPYRARVILGVVMTILVTVLQILPPRVYQAAVDLAITPGLKAQSTLRTNPQDAAALASVHHAPALLLWIALGLVAIVTLRNVFAYVNATTITWVGQRFVFDLRFAAWRHLQRLSLSYHNSTQVGKIMARVTADIELVQSLIQGQLVQFITDLVTLVAVLGMLFFLEWRLALMILALVPFYVIAYVSFLKHIRAVSQDQRRLYDEMLGKLSEKIAAIGVVKAFVREEHERADFMDTVRRKFASDMKQVHLNRRLGFVSRVVSAVGTGAVYAYGGHLVQTGEMTAGTLVAMSFYVNFIFDPAVRVVDFNNALQWAVSAMDRIFQTLDTRPEIADRPDALPLPTLRGEVTFDGVSFAYVPERTVVEELNLRIAPGEVVALVGHSGSGKTTLMNLLMRFWDPTAGVVRVDGHDLREVRLETLRRQVAMVAQENVLFSVSIMENIKYGARGATDAQAVAAAKAADLHDFVVDLPDGYETMIGEDGIKLSGGQKQRLALARALVTDPRILILDDVTSALDGEDGSAGPGCARPCDARPDDVRHRSPALLGGGRGSDPRHRGRTSDRSG